MSAPFTVKNAGASNVTFNPGLPVVGGSTYVGSSSLPTAPQQALVKHTFGLAKGKIDKHLLQFTQARSDINGVYGTATVNVTITIPPVGASPQDLADCVSFAKEFLADQTLVAKLENGTI